MICPPIATAYTNAIIHIDVDAFKNLLETEPFDESMLTDIGFAVSVPCPIQWITQCWEIILEHPEEWKEQYKDIISDKKEKNLQIKKIFTDRFHVQFTPIDFYNSELWFYKTEKDESFEDFFDNSKEDMLSKGHREIDLELYIAVQKFDFGRVKCLLEQGANPMHEIPELESYCLDSIGTECGNLEMQLDHIITGDNTYEPSDDFAIDLINIIGLGANESMYRLLSKYRSTCN